MLKYFNLRSFNADDYLHHFCNRPLLTLEYYLRFTSKPCLHLHNVHVSLCVCRLCFMPRASISGQLASNEATLVETSASSHRLIKNSFVIVFFLNHFGKEFLFCLMNSDDIIWFTFQSSLHHLERLFMSMS